MTERLREYSYDQQNKIGMWQRKYILTVIIDMVTHIAALTDYKTGSTARGSNRVIQPHRVQIRRDDKSGTTSGPKPSYVETVR